MKAIALANRLSRDLDEKSVNDLTADARLEILDAINGAIQLMHGLASNESKTTTGGIVLDEPLSVSLGVTFGSVDTTGDAFSSDQLYRTIRIDGDGIDNQIVGPNRLLHPYAGQSGTVVAIIYCDAVAVVEPYEELISNPRILETDTELTNWPRPWHPMSKPVRRPMCYQVEANARNQNSQAPSVIRFDSLPDQLYRLEAKFSLAPARIGFPDLLAPGADIPLRAEHVEAYLLPIARGIMTTSSLWKNANTKPSALKASEKAEADYEARIPRTLVTPNNRTRTKRGF